MTTQSRVLAALLLLIVCAGNARCEASQKLIYAMPITVPGVIPYIALDKGFFKEEGLDVEARMFSSGREALQALLSGQAQIQSVSETPVVHAIVQGNEIATIATVARHSEAKLIARRDAGISKPQDIAGKRVATLPGTNSDYFMYRFFEKYGISRDSVKIANMPPPEMIVAYAKGDIDAYFAWEPHISYGKSQVPDKSVIFYPGDLYSGWTTVNMQPAFAKEHPETVRAVIRALLKAETFVRDHQDESVVLVAAKLKMDPAILKNLWTENKFQVELDKGLLDSMRAEGRWAVELSKSKKELPDFRRHIDESALAKEKPSAVKL